MMRLTSPSRFLCPRHLLYNHQQATADTKSQFVSKGKPTLVIPSILTYHSLVYIIRDLWVLEKGHDCELCDDRDGMVQVKKEQGICEHSRGTTGDVSVIGVDLDSGTIPSLAISE